MDRRTQLNILAERLACLIEMLQLDPACQWRRHFEQCLESAKEYLQSGFTQDDVSGLSASVMHVYAGMGSFNDYAPVQFEPHTGRYVAIPGTESLHEVARQVYDGALSLRVVGEVT